MQEIPNIFLDSNVLFSNPFLNETFGSLLLDLAAQGEIKLYISTVALDEVKNNYKKEIRDKQQNIKKHWAALARLTNQKGNLSLKSEDELVLKLEDHLADLILKNVLLPVNYEHSLLPDLISRSISRKKPFSEKRQEFRDAVIWLSYAEYIRDNGFKKNILLTNNKADFWDEERKELHPDLKNDLPSIKIYDGFEKMFTEDQDIQAVINEKNFKDWIDKKSLSSADVSGLIRRQLHSDLHVAISERIDKVNPNKYFKNIDGVFFEYDFSIHAHVLLDFTISIVSTFAVIRCLISVPMTAYIYPKEYIWRKEKVNASIIIAFSFTLNQQEEARISQVDSLEIQGA